MNLNFLDLENICVLEVFGKDARSFLNGLLTNDIQKLKLGEGCYTLICSPKGKILADLFCFCIEEDKFRIILSKELRQKVFDLFQKYIIIQEVEIQDFSGTWDVLESLKSKIEMSTEKREILRIESMVPKYGVDMDENTLPQEAGLYHALNFQKGCYIGQETIARLEHLGHVNKLLALIQLDKEVKINSKIFSREGEEIGRITSECFSKKYKSFIALGYIRYSYAKENTIVHVGETCKGFVLCLTKRRKLC